MARRMRRIGNTRFGPVLALAIWLGLTAIGVIEWRNGQVSLFGPMGVVMVLVCLFKWRGLSKP